MLSNFLKTAIVFLFFLNIYMLYRFILPINNNIPANLYPFGYQISRERKRP